MTAGSARCQDLTLGHNGKKSGFLSHIDPETVSCLEPIFTATSANNVTMLVNVSDNVNIAP